MFFLTVPLQFGCSEPHGVPQHGAILRFVVKALGSVKHEGRTTSKQQIGRFCEALNPEAFTSFCLAYDGAMCSGLLGHHCLQSPHCVEDSTVFTSSFFCAWLHSRDLLLVLARLLGQTLRPSRSCLSMPPGNLCRAGGWRLRIKPRVEPFPFFLVVLFLFVISRCLVPHCIELTTLSLTEFRRPTRNSNSRDADSRGPDL